jgi:4-amino-4-deoxy-L-arabinose transferase-like glycosyltransferase
MRNKKIMEENPSTSLETKKNRISPWYSWGLLVIVLICGFGIRLYDLKDPPLDFHAVRQLRSALIARSVYYQLNQHVTPEIRQQANELANLEVYEPPILEQIIGATYLLMGSEQVWIVRIFDSIFWLIGGLAFFSLARKLGSFYAALLGLTFYFFLPFGIIASRSFQPEPWMVMWILLSIWAMMRWVEKPSWKWALIAGILGGVAVLVKVIAGLFVVIPLVILAFSQMGFRKSLRNLQVWCMGMVMVIPTLVYYLGFQTQRSSSFLSFWVGSLSYLVLQPSFYADWLAMIKGLTGLGLFLVALVGVLIAKKPMKAALIGLWLGYILYGLIFPYQYTTHEYYHLPLVAILALSLIPVGDALLNVLNNQAAIWRWGAMGVFIFASFYALYVSRSILYAADYRMEPPSWQAVGDAIPAESNVIGLTGDYGMRLRYYGWRFSASWPTTGDIHLLDLSNSQAINYEAYFTETTANDDLFLVTAFGELDAQPELKNILESHYPIYAEGNGFILYDLRHPLNP